MTQASLFDQVPQSVPLALVIRRDSERVWWLCPHCGANVTQDAVEETDAEVAADPACAHCRASFAGLSFSAWRRLPLEVKRGHVPPANFQRERKA